jgi:hypothetical protein
VKIIETIIDNLPRIAGIIIMLGGIAGGIIFYEPSEGAVSLIPGVIGGVFGVVLVGAAIGGVLWLMYVIIFNRSPEEDFPEDKP